ncbi:MAG TPA: 3-dehydroquinate synthase [Candidatus Aphodomonas merdavium]|nr:3-dehydroquinate synthase [Candidatus Aphodomonas merdavium]
MIRIAVPASRSYEVLIAPGLLARLGALCREVCPSQRAMLVTDSRVAPLYLQKAASSLASAGFCVSTFVFPVGEKNKNGATYLRLLNALARCGLTRSDLLLALGGGVTGDLCGFAAATYMRGIPLVQLPTTLLACVDASVGGKTAIDLAAGKNLAGAFYQPRLVLCDTSLLATLPAGVFACGCAEMIKCAMLGGPALLEAMQAAPIRNRPPEELISACVALKRDLVVQDEFDTGVRRLLNLGHTFGHALERLSGYRMPHGQAVAAGMAIITRAAVRKGICPQECMDALGTLLAQNGLQARAGFRAQALFEAALLDKKRAGDTITLVVPTGIGRCELLEQPVQALCAWAHAGLDA